MNVFNVADTVTIAVSAFLSGRFLSCLVRAWSGTRWWPLIRSLCLTTLGAWAFLAGIFVFSCWPRLHWQVVIDDFFVACAWAANRVYQRQRRGRSHITITPSRNSQTV